MSECDHSSVRQVGRHWGFAGPVAQPPYTDENPAAHGNIGVTEECRTCGSRRAVLINGRHAEVGPWGDSLASREAEARSAEARAASALRTTKPLRLRREDTGEELVLSLDGKGYVVADASRDLVESALRSEAGSAWLEAACDVRRLVIEAEGLRAEVT